jgi:hypothetical protein
VAGVVHGAGDMEDAVSGIFLLALFVTLGVCWPIGYFATHEDIRRYQTFTHHVLAGAMVICSALFVLAAFLMPIAICFVMVRYIWRTW